MIIFKNDNINLLEYLPHFMQEYKHIKQIMESENPEFNFLWARYKRLFNNQFIEHCNEEGIAKFESMLKIVPFASDTLEVRIFRVLTAWNDDIPYTYRVLVDRLNQLCGVDNYVLNLKHNDYILEITTYFDDVKKYDVLNNLLETIKPANLGVKSVNVLQPKIINNIYIGAWYDVRNKINIECKIGV